MSDKFLEKCLFDPEKNILGHNHLTPQEYESIVYQWNKTNKKYKKYNAVHELFEVQVNRNPENTAAIFGNETLSYRELNEKSNQLARYLRSQYKVISQNELTFNPLIAVYMERGIEMIICLLGIVKSGGAYLPLDPEYPDERINYMLEDSQVKIVLTRNNLITRLEAIQKRHVVINLDAPKIFNHLLSTNLNIPHQPDNIAYVCYTSGTSGKPKGVLNTHRGLLNRIQWSIETYSLTEDDKLLQIAASGFDISVWEMLFPLLSGAQLIIAKTGIQRSVVSLRKLIFDENISFLHIVPSLLNVLVEHPEFSINNPLKQVLTGGETVSLALRQKFMRTMQCKLYIAYGPTEAAISVTHLDCAKDTYLKGSSIGRAIANTLLYVLDDNLKPVPIGVRGELYIGGANLARGYLNRPDLTQDRFILNPFITKAHQLKGYIHLYKTGDLVRWLPDGNLEFIGRADNQIKLRGFRIELEEIENVVKSYADVLDCVVTVRNINDIDYLIAYFILQQNSNETKFDLKQLREYLIRFLPNFMVPSYLIKLNELPITVHGKIDRKTLPDPSVKDRFFALV
jgi:amino acid adenylation domain-containing protein